MQTATKSDAEFIKAMAKKTSDIIADQTKKHNLDRDTAEKVAAQKIYCMVNSVEFYAPVSTCWSCGKNHWKKVDLKKAETELITGCGYCNRSYVE